jgi:hypothetical protein
VTLQLTLLPGDSHLFVLSMYTREKVMDCPSQRARVEIATGEFTVAPLAGEQILID